MEVGKLLVVIGLLLVVAGLVLWLAPQAFSWFGHLPGDIRIEHDGVYVFVPVTSMIVVSLLLTAFLNLAAWLLKSWS